MRTDTAIRRQISQYLDTNQLSMAEMERRSGIGGGTLSGIMSGSYNAGKVVFEKLDKLIGFDQAAHLELAINLDNARKRRQSQSKLSPQPWPVTLANLLRNPPIYARAW